MHRCIRPTPPAVFVAPYVLLAVMTASAAALPAAQRTDAEPSAVYRGAGTAVKFDVSPPLSSIVSAAEGSGVSRAFPAVDFGQDFALGPQDADPLVQSKVGPSAIPNPFISFDGPDNLCDCAPPSPNGDVGAHEFVLMTNVSLEIYDKAGNSLLGPVPNNVLWSGFGGPCETRNDGDPVALYDPLADRWLLTQFAVPEPTYYLCIAVSTTGDPTGSYYRYAFNTGTRFPDYPKYGVWPDAYYVSTAEFEGGMTFAGVGAYALDRARMLAGDPNAQAISFLVPPTQIGRAHV